MPSKFKKIVIGVSFLGLIFVFPPETVAQVVINEFSSNNGEDWVELYNNSDQNIDLSTYSLVDITQSGNKKTLNCVLASKGFVVMGWSDSLNNGGDTFKLKNGEIVVDCVSYGSGAGQICEGRSSQDLPALSAGEYGARTVDGSGGWVVKTNHTKDSPNDGVAKDPSAVCSAPTPVATPAPSPTQSPTASPMPTSTKTPIPTKSPTPKPTPKPSPTATSQLIELPTDILGIRNEMTETEEPSPTPQNSEEKKKFPILAATFVLLGLLLVSGSGFALYKKLKAGYTETHDEEIS